MQDHPHEVLTPRLRLRALSLDDARLVLRGDRHALATRVGAYIPTDWPGPALTASLPGIVERIEARPADAYGWVWVVIDSQAAAVVGDIGFHSPVRGVASVEIGYLIFPEARGRGLATEAAVALLTWAFPQPGGERVTAHI